MTERKRYTNRLAKEKSPYLLQHAHNPVDWYPWGKEAFEKAKELDKPIFLSIGYATCHWCHAMERESFENPEIAELMNEAFINIKVDREEHPEVDNILTPLTRLKLQGLNLGKYVWRKSFNAVKTVADRHGCVRLLLAGPLLNRLRRHASEKRVF